MARKKAQVVQPAETQIDEDANVDGPYINNNHFELNTTTGTGSSNPAGHAEQRAPMMDERRRGERRGSDRRQEHQAA